MTKLVIIRGASGSGKSTYAKTNYRGYVNYEADQYFYRPDGIYQFDFRFLKNAHQWCQQKVEHAMLDGENIVVSNTFVQLWEMQAYLDLAKQYGYEVEVIEMKTQYQNIHDVPDDKVQSMIARFQPYAGAIHVN